MTTDDQQPELPLIMTDDSRPPHDDRTPADHLPTGPCDCLQCLAQTIIRNRRATTAKPVSDDREVA